MNQKPKRKSKNKNLNSDEQIESLLDDDEYIIWSEQTQQHYYDFVKNKMRKITFWGGFIIISIFTLLTIFSPQTDLGFIAYKSILAFLPLVAFPGILILMLANANSKKYLYYVNVITNYQILTYDLLEKDIVSTFAYDNVQTFAVKEYGENVGSIILDSTIYDKPSQYKVKDTFPLKFTLRGINNLSEVTSLLRSQLGIEPEYLQIHQKRK